MKDIKLKKEEYTNRFFKGTGFEIIHQLPKYSVDIVLCDLLYGSAQNKWDFVVTVLLEGRIFIAIEKNEDVELFKENKVDYIEIIKQRLKSAWNKLDLLKKKAIIKLNEIKKTIIVK